MGIENFKNNFAGLDAENRVSQYYRNLKPYGNDFVLGNTPVAPIDKALYPTAADPRKRTKLRLLTRATQCQVLRTAINKLLRHQEKKRSGESKTRYGDLRVELVDSMTHKRTAEEVEPADAGFEWALEVWHLLWYPVMHSLYYIVEAYKLIRDRLFPEESLAPRWESLIKLWIECWYLLRQGIERGVCWRRELTGAAWHLLLETAKAWVVLVQEFTTTEERTPE